MEIIDPTKTVAATITRGGSGFGEDFNPNELGEDSGYTSLEKFDSNIGTVARAYVDNFRNARIVYEIKESIPQNVGKRAGLQFPLDAPTNTFTKNEATGKWEKVPVTDANTLAAMRKDWQRGWAKIMHVTGLSVPTAETLGNDVLATAWLQTAEGTSAVFSAYDKDGYGQISCNVFGNVDRKAYVAIARLDDAAKDKKQRFGVTRADEARAKIAAEKAKS
jgi:hypothetical protein